MSCNCDELKECGVTSLCYECRLKERIADLEGIASRENAHAHMFREKADALTKKNLRLTFEVGDLYAREAEYEQIVAALKTDRDVLREEATDPLRVELAVMTAERDDYRQSARKSYLRIRKSESNLRSLLLAAEELEIAEAEYRRCHDHYTGDDMRTGRAWDQMRQHGDNLRAEVNRIGGK